MRDSIVAAVSDGLILSSSLVLTRASERRGLARYRRAASAAVLIALTVTPCFAAPSGPPSTISFDLVFPLGYGLNGVTVAANGDMLLFPGDRIQASDGSPGTVTNSGSGPLNVMPQASAGTLVSTGDVHLSPNVVAASVTSSGVVTLSPGVRVGQVQQHATLAPLVHRTLIVPSLSGTPSDVSIGSSASLSPGRYGTVTAGHHAIVTVSAGTYLVDRFVLGPQAELQLNTSGGTVNIYVTTSVTWQGMVSGDASRFVFSFLGQDSLVFLSAFRGTALVPFGTMELRPSSTLFEGTFYAQHLVVGPQVTIRKLSTPLLIDGMSVSNTVPCVGEPLEVSVDTRGAGPAATTWIQDVVGSHQFVQFSGPPGPRAVYATVYTADGHADFARVPITVQDCPTQPGSARPIALHFWHAIAKPNVVELVVHNYDSNGHEIPAKTPATYVWSFGDGQTLTTSSPFVWHDYTAAIQPMAQYNYFDVSVAATGPSGTTIVTKVVPIWSLYAKNRAKGIVQPPNTLSVSSSGLALAVTNYESTPISITQANIELIPCDPDSDPRPQPPQSLSLTVAAGATSTVGIARPPSVTSDICSLAIHLIGSATAGRVYTDAYLTLKENTLLVHPVTDNETITLLDQASALTNDPDRFDELELRQLYGQGLISRLPPPDQPALPKVLTLRVGDQCTPGDTSPLGLLCAPTAGWVFVGPEILNAFKGNFIMDHGCGSIGKLLSAAHQLYSHTSTIVQNRVAVRHSTASADRMSDPGNIDFSKLKLDGDVLRYGFPGTAGADQIYTIDQMVSSYSVTDPDNSSNQWTIGGELNPNPSRCDNDTTAILPLVVRPAPDAPATVLQSVASVVEHTNINSHYRFFNYTRADELLPGSGWATGTESTVCSSFDWLAAKRAGLTLHPTLGLPNVPDGMRMYSVDERTAGGFALFNNMHDQVEAKCDEYGKYLGGIGILFCDDLSDNIANQVANCFANDGCGDGRPVWQENPGTGIAVSPDDILDWDTFHNGGTYGYNEPFVYKPKAFRHAYAWTSSSGSGSMIVKIVHTNNAPYPSATVLMNTNAIGTTDSAGTFLIPVLAAGTYEVGAQFDPCAATGHPNTCALPLEQASIMATLAPNGSITVVLILCAGPVVNGVVTSCPQTGQGPVLDVRMTETQEGPTVCFVGSGFTNGGHIDIVYDNVPGRTVNRTSTTTADPTGNLNFTDRTWERYLDQFCTQDQLDGTVTISVLDNVSDIAKQTDVPAAYWCAASFVATNYRGGCQ